jgi:prepilin-type N-terminal cleavage/methylation domain-containing protein
MKTPQFKNHRSQGFTLIELLVVISIIAILASIAIPTMNTAMMRARFASTVSNAKQIGLGMRMYASAHDGQFPLYKDTDNASTMVATSNEALELLMPRYAGGDKTIFTNKQSAWCKPQPATAADQYRLRAGECDWAYVRGLSETSDSRLPLLATAFAPGGTTYVKDNSKPGGVWKGELAAVLRIDGSVMSVQKLKENGSGTFIKRPDNAAKNMFEKDTDWLDGDNVQVLMPISGS